MRNEKSKKDIQFLKNAISLFCKNKHIDQKYKKISFNYKDISYEFELNLCDECYEKFLLVSQKLQNCKMSNKPKCRLCKDNCYSKEDKKYIAKIMIYAMYKKVFS